jgi:hypothetical protein
MNKIPTERLVHPEIAKTLDDLVAAGVLVRVKTERQDQAHPYR